MTPSSPLTLDEIMEVCQRHGWKAQMTSSAHRSGTERVQEISQSVAADVYLNIQGDEPMTRAEHIAGLIEVMQDPAVQVGTLMTAAAPADINNPSAVKVVTDSAGRALYFSRATIPYDRDGAGPKYFKHLGFYAYRKPALDRFVALPESALERSERLEQLRFLENGIGIHVPRDAVRHRGGGHRGRPAPGGRDPRFTFLVFRIGPDSQNRSGRLRMALWIFFHSSLTCRATSGFTLRS